VSSKADDFDVRYRDGRDGRAWGNGAEEADNGGYVGDDHEMPGGTVDYELSYDANGWDTQGFRSPTAGYLDNSETTQRDSAAQRGNGRGGSHARTTGTQQVDPLSWAPDAPGSTGPWLPVPPGPPVPPGRRGRRAKPGGGGPQGPRGPQQKVKVKGSWWRHWTWRKALGVVLGVIGGFIVLLAAAVAYIYSKTPVPAEGMAINMSAQSVVYASDGHTVIGRFGSTDRQVVNYQQIPAQIIYSVLSAEDRNFFNEGGVSPTSIVRAAWEDTLGGGNFQGGSTITQQFVRNYYQGIGTSPTASRKIKEIFVAMKISRQKSKKWILENYLNTIYLGQGAYGIGAAAQTYFNIPVSRLSTISWSQAALLAAIIQQPSTYPLPQYRNDLEARWQYVREGLLKMGWITPQQYGQMTFPRFGDYAPGSFGSDVWDPYVMDVVKNEMTDVYGYTEPRLLNGGYKIVTTIDPAKMAALYQAVITEKQQMAAGGEPLQSYMRIGAVLENPQTGAIEAFYGGPGYPGYKYDGHGHRVTVHECNVISCEVNMGIYAREQVGSSFKPYVLSAAVAAGMNVQTSVLDGQDFVCIPPDSKPNTFPTPEPAPNATNGGCTGSSYGMSNDSTSENGAFNAQDAMTNSVNTAYADLWHKVGGGAVATIAKEFGVDTDAACITAGCGTPKHPVAPMEHETGVALGQASLSVLEQATMLSAIDNGGTYHAAHVIGSISQGGAHYPLTIRSHPVFNGVPTQNADMDSQVQYAMSKVAYDGTGAAAGMSDGRPIIAKTGTTNSAQSAFFIGAIPQESLAVGIFTNLQSQTLNGLGGISQGFGGTWPAMIWHSYAQNMFLPLGVEQFPPVAFTGSKWNLAPPNLLKKPHKKKNHQNPNPGNGFPTPGGNGNPNPYPTYSCDPTQVTCNGQGGPGGGGNQSVSAPAVGAAVGGIFAALPATCLWVRRRTRKQVRKRG
jgi:membrane peptidoglycan carboxypeptidase